MAQWYIAQDGKEQGPISGAELKARVMAGTLQRDDLVRRDDMQTPVKASAVKGLFPDIHTKIRKAADSAGETAETVKKVAENVGKVADAANEVADATEKLRQAATSIAGIAGAISAFAGSIGDFLRPLGNINLLIFLVAGAATPVLVVVARRQSKKALTFKYGAAAVATLAVAVIFGLWCGLAAIASNGDKGVLATNVKPIDRLQESVVTARKAPTLDTEPKQTIPVPAPTVQVKTAQSSIEFFASDGEIVCQYHFPSAVSRPYLWPVNASGQIAMTRAWPIKQDKPGETNDHPHQRSCWFGHGDIIPKGIDFKKVKDADGVDFWTDQEGHGLIVCKEVEKPTLSKKHGKITSRNEWQTASGIKLMDEMRTIHLIELEGARLIVFDIDLNASAAPITFGDTKEGGFGIRVNDLLREKFGNGKIEIANGRTGEKACWGQVSAWCDCSGQVEGRSVGIALLADPSNPYPSCWHCRGYGLIAANPFGRAKSGFPAMQGNPDLVKLVRGEHLKFRFGVLVHQGDAKEGRVAEHYKQFVQLGP